MNKGYEGVKLVKKSLQRLGRRFHSRNSGDDSFQVMESFKMSILLVLVTVWAPAGVCIWQDFKIDMKTGRKLSRPSRVHDAVGGSTGSPMSTPPSMSDSCDAPVLFRSFLLQDRQVASTVICKVVSMQAFRFLRFLAMAMLPVESSGFLPQVAGRATGLASRVAAKRVNTISQRFASGGMSKDMAPMGGLK